MRRPNPTVLFIVVTAFLNLSGVGIIAPVVPFLVGKYTTPENSAFVGSLLFTAFALFQFLASPTLGALSDRYGRRPVLLVSLLGSAVGYFMLGIGGSLWMLFAGRIIDGITGGNIATIYAYAADITEPQNRTRFFGVLGAASGMGFVFGPIVGGVSSALFQSSSAPLYLAGLLTLANVVWGYFAMPESLPHDRRVTDIPLARLNPFTQLLAVLNIPEVRMLLVGTFLWAMSFAALQANLSFLTEEQLGWDQNGTYLIFTIVGIVGIITQGGLVRRLQPVFGEARLSIGGMALMVIGFLLIATVAATHSPALLILGVIVTGVGNGLVVPSLSGLLSQLVSGSEQGRIQGGSQSVQALARVIGPIWAGWAYTQISGGSPYLMGAAGLFIAAVTVAVALRGRFDPVISSAD
jgi:MFS transporter, DHA1 family, tetracycline resistance protein